MIHCLLMVADIWYVCTDPALACALLYTRNSTLMILLFVNSKCEDILVFLFVCGEECYGTVPIVPITSIFIFLCLFLSDSSSKYILIQIDNLYIQKRTEENREKRSVLISRVVSVTSGATMSFVRSLSLSLSFLLLSL